MMVQINDQTIYNYNIDMLLKIDELIEFQYSTGEIEHITPSELAINLLIWEGICFKFNLEITPLLSITNYYTNGFFTANTLTSLFSTVVKRILAILPLDNNRPMIIKEVIKSIFEINNRIYNLGFEFLGGVRDMSILDILEVQLNSKIMKAIEKFKKTHDPKDLEECYKIINDILVNDRSLVNNNFSKAYRAGTIKKGQALQVVGPRGYVTEINGSIFKNPITNSFTLGMDSMYEYMIESRSAAKSLYESTISIKNTEYFGRKLQMIAMYVEHIEHTDCGTTDTMTWLVEDGDIKNMLGKYYKLNPNDKEWKIINGNENLVGKTIYVRTVINCKLKDKFKVCSCCYGETATSIPMHANVGHISGSTLSGRGSQSVLSTKHLITTAAANAIYLDDIGKEYFIIKKNGFALNIESLSKYDKVLMYVNIKEFPGLSTIKKQDDIQHLDIYRVSKLDTVYIETYKGDEITKIPVQIFQNGRYGSFTSNFLKHVYKNYSMYGRKQYIIDITKYKQLREIIVLPEVEFSFSQLIKQIENHILSANKYQLTQPEALISKVFRLINSKLSLNLSMVETLVYAFTTADKANGNYDLGRFSKESKLASFNDLLATRSLGTALDLGYLKKTLDNPIIFKKVNKPSHVMDAVLFKKEAIIEYAKRYKIKFSTSPYSISNTIQQ